MLVEVKIMRKEAYQLLRIMDEKQAYSNLVLNDFLKTSTMSRVDQDLLTRMVYGVISHQLYLEYQLKALVSKLPKKKIRTLLYLSLYQLYFLDKVPSYAVCDEAVKIAKSMDPKLSSFVNAVLRKAVKQGPVDVSTGHQMKDLSISYSMPLSIIEKLTQQYDKDTVEAILKDSLEVPKTCVRINALKPINFEGEKGQLVTTAVIVNKGNVAHLSEYKQGHISIQDEASQLVALHVNPQTNETILDMCGAPGGKTCHMAELMGNSGHIDVFDIYDHKIDLINQATKRLGINIVHAFKQDATNLQHLNTVYDRILLDGPCSGLGVLKRKPEIKYRDIDFDGLVKLQRQLMSQVDDHLKVGGTFVYSTCTLNKDENEANVQWFLKQYPNYELVNETTILPYVYHTDGFFIATLLKHER